MAIDRNRRRGGAMHTFSHKLRQRELLPLFLLGSYWTRLVSKQLSTKSRVKNRFVCRTHVCGLGYGWLRARMRARRPKEIDRRSRKGSFGRQDNRSGIQRASIAPSFRRREDGMGGIVCVCRGEISMWVLVSWSWWSIRLPSLKMPCVSTPKHW